MNFWLNQGNSNKKVAKKTNGFAVHRPLFGNGAAFNVARAYCIVRAIQIRRDHWCHKARRVLKVSIHLHYCVGMEPLHGVLHAANISPTKTLFFILNNVKVVEFLSIFFYNIPRAVIRTAIRGQIIDNQKVHAYVSYFWEFLLKKFSNHPLDVIFFLICRHDYYYFIHGYIVGIKETARIETTKITTTEVTIIRIAFPLGKPYSFSSPSTKR